MWFIYLFTYLFIWSLPPYSAEHKSERGSNFKCVLTDNPPGIEEAGHTTDVYVPYSSKTVGWVLLRPTITR